MLWAQFRKFTYQLFVCNYLNVILSFFVFQDVSYEFDVPENEACTGSGSTVDIAVLKPNDMIDYTRPKRKKATDVTDTKAWLLAFIFLLFGSLKTTNAAKTRRCLVVGWLLLNYSYHDLKFL